MRAVRPATLAAALLGVVAALALPAAPALADGTRDKQWWISTLDLKTVHTITKGAGITVAVVDSGVDATHPDLKGNVLPGANFNDGDEGEKGQVDHNGHGTSVAALIAGHGHGSGNADGIIGIAPDAKILPVNVIREQGLTDPSRVVAGMNWAIDNGADIINVSINSGYDADFQNVVNRAVNRGILVVAGTTNKTDQIPVGYPASITGVMGVSAVDEQGKQADSGVADPDNVIVAPGEDMPVAQPGGKYGNGEGVSLSTAIVSGAAALVKAQNPDLDYVALYKQIAETAQDAGDKGRDEVFGWGILDVKNALTGTPDNRIAIAAANSPEQQLLEERARLQANLDAKDADTAARIAKEQREKKIVILVGLGILAVVVVLVVLLLIMRARRRQRAAEEEDYDEEAEEETVPPAPQDNSGWQRPPTA